MQILRNKLDLLAFCQRRPGSSFYLLFSSLTGGSWFNPDSEVELLLPQQGKATGENTAAWLGWLLHRDLVQNQRQGIPHGIPS